jgi:hypothetical protein
VGDSGHFLAARRSGGCADAVSRFVLGLFGQAGWYAPGLAPAGQVGGTPGLYAETVPGRPPAAPVTCSGARGRITGIFN